MFVSGLLSGVLTIVLLIVIGALFVRQNDYFIRAYATPAGAALLSVLTSLLTLLLLASFGVSRGPDWVAGNIIGLLATGFGANALLSKLRAPRRPMAPPQQEWHQPPGGTDRRPLR